MDRMMQILSANFEVLFRQVYNCCGYEDAEQLFEENMQFLSAVIAVLLHLTIAEPN